jgi:hypothetical protein
MELSFGMCGVRFNRGESGLLAADRTPVFDAVLKAHVTSFPPGLKAMTAPRTAGSVPGGLAMAARSIEACSFHVTVSRRLSEGPNLSTYVKDTSAPAGGTTLLPYDSEAVRNVQNEPSRPQ